MPEQANETVLIYNTLEMLSHFDHIPMAFLNGTNWVSQVEPLISVPRTEWDERQFVPEIKGNMEWVDIVVNNRDDKGHPFHLVSQLPFLPSFNLIFSIKSNIFSARTRFLRPYPPLIPAPSRLSNL
jgi:hypothetical protein